MGRVTAIAYVRYQAPDLSLAEEFFTDFGLVPTSRSPSALYMRGTGSDHHIHITEIGEEAKGIGIGLRVGSREDLEVIAARAGTDIKDSDEPGGGIMTILTDPNGFRVDIIYGDERAEPLPVRSPLSFNTAATNTRLGSTPRPERGPSHVVRIEHAVLAGPNFDQALEFYQSLLGFEISDSIYFGAPEARVVAFLHCGLGSTFTDHHTVALIRNAETAVEHSAFVTLDWDDLMLGHEHLKSKGRYHEWGVGRHIMGSEVFDYWRDPFGNKVEHCFDGDMVNDSYVPGNIPADGDIMAVWSPPISETFGLIKAGTN